MAPVTFHLLLFSIAIAPCILAAHVTRDVNSNATCVDGYQWMDNAQGDSPCLTVAYVEAACTGNVYSQPALQVGYSYSLPNSSTAGPCYCSWSSYNLMMACTICQGANFSQSLWQWPQWESGCSSNPSWTDVYFPSGFVLSGDASIPYWATLNPANWTYQTFNVEDAQAVSQQNSSSIVPSSSSSGASSSSSSSKSTDVGAIVGGTVGGAAALVLLVVGAYLLYRRRIYRQGAYASAVNQRGTGYMNRSNGAPMSMTHSRFPSDTSTYLSRGRSLSPSQQYAVYSPQPQTVYPSIQGSFSPPRTDTSVYTTRGAQSSGPIPLV